MEILNSGTKRSREIELRKCPTDLFHSFLPTSPNTTLRHQSRHQSPEPGKQEHGEEELNLGLSLGGRFGVDKSHKGLVRSSSLAAAIPLMRAEEAAAAALVRTASLPPATEEEWRKRKDLQSLRRLEAKRKRSDKQRCIRENGSGENLNLNSDPGQHGKPNPGSGYPVHWANQAMVKSGFCGELQGLFIQQQNQGSSGDSQGESLNLNPGLPGKPNPVSGYPKSGYSGDLQGLSIQQQKQDGCQGSSGDSQGEKSGICGDMQGLLIQQQKQDGSQGSGESQGASKSSSNASEPERNTIQGSCCGTRTAEVSSNKKLDSLDSQKDSSRGGENGMGSMPCVFTIGDGPKGRKVEGVLYRYKKGEEVRIMCICHGSFFTPAEFVNHAGAHNVAHPLKRIVVNPNASPF